MDIAHSGEVPNIAEKAFVSASFFLKEHSPVILTSAGVVGLVAAGVLASRATLKLEPVLEKHREEVRKAHAAKADLNDSENGKALLSVHTRTGWELTKLYWGPITLTGLSIMSIATGYGILNDRYLTTASLLKASEASFNEYRKQVAKILGDDVEQELHLGVREEVVENEETGNEETKKYLSVNGRSPYAKVFAQNTSSSWQREHSYNEIFINAKEQYFNWKLQAHGKVFLSDVYKELGLEETKASHLVGWAKNEGDNLIIFTRETFSDESGTSILLDFNVDGVIINKIPEI